MPIPIFHVDAFTSRPFAGNPAAVCLLDGWLDDEWLRKVAAENNLSETAYLVPCADGYELRWFTPRCEVKLCGHATLAAAFIVLNLLNPGRDVVRFETRFSGELTVSRQDDLFTMDFPAWAPQPCGEAPEALLKGLGSGTRPQAVFEGNETYIAVYESEALVRAIKPDFGQLERLHPLAASITSRGDTVDFVSRYFAPSYGIPEDPVTGSAHCLLAPYWAERLGKNQMHAQQVSQRGGEIWCEVLGSRVAIRGEAVLTLRGSLLL
jgi:PhzF family phenazine biosynthesis protein